MQLTDYLYVIFSEYKNTFGQSCTFEAKSAKRGGNLQVPNEYVKKNYPVRSVSEPVEQSSLWSEYKTLRKKTKQ